jgi:tRNA(fMet)-specific endonuclease VapC
MLDTNMCIYIIKKKTERVLKELQDKRKDGLAISTITLAELEYGNENSQYKEKNTLALMQFLAIIDVKPFDEKASKEFGRIKKDLRDRKCLLGEAVPKLQFLEQLLTHGENCISRKCLPYKELAIFSKSLFQNQPGFETSSGPYDMLIGAHARSLGLTLVTNNVKEFERIADLKIENWV